MKIILTSFFLLGLTGCESVELPHVLSGNEVPPGVINEPRLVATPAPDAAQDMPWMRLGDVPSKPTDFTPEPVIQKTRQEMTADRAYADSLKQAVDNPAPIPLSSGSQP